MEHGMRHLEVVSNDHGQLHPDHHDLQPEPDLEDLDAQRCLAVHLCLRMAIAGDGEQEFDA